MIEWNLWKKNNSPSQNCQSQYKDQMRKVYDSSRLLSRDDCAVAVINHILVPFSGLKIFSAANFVPDSKVNKNEFIYWQYL